ncbi:MAG: hypothetical protein ACFCBW_05690 [Candidatus Competibacterales bacterium]
MNHRKIPLNIYALAAESTLIISTFSWALGLRALQSWFDLWRAWPSQAPQPRPLYFPIPPEQRPQGE